MNKLKAARLKCGLTVRETAKALNVSEKAMREYERGNRVPRDSIKQAMAALYCVPVPSLFF